MVKLDPGKDKNRRISFNHLETEQSEAKASPRKPKVTSLWRSENWGCMLSSTKPSMTLKMSGRRLYLRDLAGSVWPYHGRYLGNITVMVTHAAFTLKARNITKEGVTPHPLSLTLILTSPKSSRRTLKSYVFCHFSTSAGIHGCQYCGLPPGGISTHPPAGRHRYCQENPLTEWPIARRVLGHVLIVLKRAY